MDRLPAKLTSTLLGAVLGLAPLPVMAAAPAEAAASEPADSERGQQLFDNGRRLFDEGSYDASIVAFKAAYEILQEPNLLYNIHLAYERLENYEAAIEYLDKYRALAAADEQDELQRRRDSLETRRQRAVAMAAANEEAQAKTADGDPPSAQTQPKQEQPPRKDIKVFGPGAIAATVIAVVAGGVGLGLGLGSNARKAKAEDACNDGFCRESFEGDASASRSMAIGADVSFAVAGVAAIVAITLVAVNASRKRTTADTARRFELTPGGVRARF